MIFRKIAEELDVGFGSIRRDELVDTLCCDEFIVKFSEDCERVGRGFCVFGSNRLFLIRKIAED